MTLKEKLEKAEKMGIIFDETIRNAVLYPSENEYIVGVYGFFACKGDKESCFYVGKATSMIGRLFTDKKAHIHEFLYERSDKLVPKKIKEYLDKGYKIRVKILKEVDYHDTYFSRAAHRLALAELNWIVEYQDKGECIEQRPEGAGPNVKAFWEKNFKKLNK